MLFILCKSLLDYTNLFFPNDYEKNDQIINNEKDKNIYIYITLFAVSVENLKSLKYLLEITYHIF